jgi:hypothetical protein
MPRKRTIKWRESDAEKLTKQIESFNAKIYRTRRKHPELNDILPDTIKKADKQKMINELKTESRSEFNKTIRSLDRFTKRGAEQEIVSATGNRVTKWEKREIGLKVAQINRERTRERKIVENMEATSRGENLGLKRGEMGSVRLNELRPKKFNFDKIKGGKEWERFKASVEKQASPQAKNKRMEDYKASYIKGLRIAFGDYADDIISIIEELPAETVVKTYYAEQEATIEFFYEPQEMNFKLDVLSDIWQGVKDDYDDEIHG